MKALTVDLPYPEITDGKVCRRTLVALTDLYAGAHGELNAILQYLYHSLKFENEGDTETAELLNSIALAEMEHLEILAKLITAVGGDPVYGVTDGYGINYYSGSFVSYSKTPKKMLLDDISGEMTAVESYTRAAERTEDENVAAVLTRIRLDEELHIVALKGALEKAGVKSGG